jgi:hypothetical protein
MESRSTSNLKDITLICCDCGGTFHFSIGEQLYFASKQLSQPKRCPSCRRKRRSTLVPDPETMKHGRTRVPPGDYTTLYDCRS